MPIQGKYKSFSIGYFLSMRLSSVFDLEAQACVHAETRLFPEWRCSRREVLEAEKEDVQEYLPGSEESVLFKIASLDAESFEGRRLRRFESFLVRVSEKGGIVEDVILNVGGPMYDLAWCPQPFGFSRHPSPEVAHTFLAVTAHKYRYQVHSIGVASGGYNMIQIWDLGYLTNMGIFSSDGLSPFEPFMTLGILHRGSCAVDLTWCPRGSPHPSSLDWDGPADLVPRLGILAAALADGSCNIYAVPHPIFLRKARGMAESDRRSIYLELRPVYQLVYSNRSLPLQVAWSHHDDCRLLAIGCTDGSVDIWKLPTYSDGQSETTLQPMVSTMATARQSAFDMAESEALDPSGENPEGDLLSGDKQGGIAIPTRKIQFHQVPLWHRKSHPSPIRSLLWHPSNSRFFATGAMDSSIKVWDVNLADVPLASVSVSGGTVLDMDWAGKDSDYAIVVACDEGGIRHFGPNCSRIYDFHSFGCWGINISPILSLQTSCDTQGKVYCMTVPEKRSKVGGVEVCIERLRLETSAKFEKKDKYEKTRPTVEANLCDASSLYAPESSDDFVLCFAESSVRCGNQLTPAHFKNSSRAKQGRPKKGEIRQPEKKVPTKKKPAKQVLKFKDPLLTLYKTKWNPNTIAPSWIAYGGMAGLMRVQFLAWTKPF
ncbi:uncharacterized protein LOC126329081 [Schistocerca gregaria]|uniref:uncharacterized protein LOC126329081 n=1 Tax=Schistocerca gregaria TaxID=7010 RepID=UPI00211E1D0F|nr:uncharacterized protein LOC126329081 [Schistocerca gregaria]